MFKKLFGKKQSLDDGHDEKRKLQRAHTVDGSQSNRHDDDVKKLSRKTSQVDKPVVSSKPAKNGADSKPAPAPRAPKSEGTAAKRRKKQRKSAMAEMEIDTSVPLEYPCTPEMIMEYHKHKSFLSQNEEWLMVELNEYECLVDSEEIIKIIAKHSKFFELDPPELWEEFFEFVEDMPSYDEVVNYDVWQEFRDIKYPC